MSSTIIETRWNARPTRPVFMLATPDRAQLLNVISRATTLWGGRYNPIIILDDAGRTVVGRPYTLAPPDPRLKQQADLLMQNVDFRYDAKAPEGTSVSRRIRVGCRSKELIGFRESDATVRIS
jgi:hypothetical protein